MANTLLSQVWQEAGTHASEVFVLQQLEMILTEAGKIPQRLQLGEVHVIDNGDGNALSSLVQVYPQMISQYLNAVEQILAIKLS
jgi:flotillin